MLIDWVTVGAQVLNFVILVWLMKRFLYRPILNAVDARERRIAAELADADAQKAEAHRERDEYARKNQELDRERAGLMAQATDEAASERKRLLQEARTAADGERADLQEKLQIDTESLNRAIGHRIQEEVFAVSRKALADLATVSLEERLTDVFVCRVRALDGPAKTALSAALMTATSSDPALIRSAFELPGELRATIQQVLNSAFSAEIPLRFETRPDLIGGVELIAQGQKIAWSIADYLTSLEAVAGDLLTATGGPEAGPAEMLETLRR